MPRLSAVAAALVALLLPATSMAERDAIDIQTSCECICEVKGGSVAAVAGSYSVPLGGCTQLNGKTCNREAIDPVTGVRLIRSGTLYGCAQEDSAAGARAEELDPGEPQQSLPGTFNKQLILQTPTVDPGEKPGKKKPLIVVPLGSITTAPQ
jgi:hypothetical protein